MKTIITCNTLAIEVTRRCNMKCEHCLRGEMQTLDISLPLLRKIAQTIHPDNVSFTGGEPSLNVNAIRKYFEYAERYGTMPMSFFVATNGLSHREELALALLETYPKMGEKDMCELAVSTDAFHAQFWNEKYPESWDIFSGLSFFNKESKAHDASQDDFLWVIPEGRAEFDFADYGRTAPSICTTLKGFTSGADIYPDKMDFGNGYMEDVVNVHFEMLYVAANGNIVENCDVSYEHVDANHVTTINTILEDIKPFTKPEAQST